MNSAHQTEARRRPARDVLRIFWQFSRDQKGKIAAILFAAGAAELVQNVIAPLYYKKFVNQIAQAGERSFDVLSAVLWTMGMIVGMRLLASLLTALKYRLNISFQLGIMSRLRVAAYEKVLNQSYQFFSDSFTGSLVHRINDLANAFEVFADSIMTDIWTLLFTTIGALIVIFSRDAWIGVVVLIWVVLIIVGNYAFAMWRLKYDLERAEKRSISGGVLADGITNALNIKACATTPQEVARFERSDQDFRRIQRYTWETNRQADLFRSISILILEAIVLGLAAWKWSLGSLTVGDVVLFQAYILALQGKISNIGRVIRMIFTSIADAKEGVEILNQQPSVRDHRTAKPLAAKRGAVEFQDVAFNYHQTRTILDHFSLKISPREKIALVGSSGAGKSTVIKLLFRFYDVDDGTISIDGQDISKVTQDSLRNAVALVPQEPILFHRSLRENIGYGKDGATEREIIDAAKKAHCHEFISDLPQGYDTLVGERGVKLSGGERQRVAIARAILKNAPILVLDEATSSLDSESESLIQDALKKLMKNKTVIVIAHRLSTIMQMDRIIVMDQGRVVDQGTHDELLQRVGIYQKLWNIQAGGFVGEG